MNVDNLNNVAVRIPEYILLYGLKAGINYLKTDYNNNIADTTKSLLYYYLRNVGIERYEFFAQAVKIFTAAVDDPRALTLDLMYNREKNDPPSMYITMPAEQSSQNTLAFGQNDDDAIFTPPDNSGQNAFYRPSYKRRFQTTYALVITSDNADEVILLYHVMRALIISMNAHFSLAGLQNLSLGGADLNNYNKEIPGNFFVRSINISFQYETNAVDFSKSPMITSMMFQGTPYLPNTSTTTTTTTTSSTTTTTT